MLFWVLQFALTISMLLYLAFCPSTLYFWDLFILTYTHLTDGQLSCFYFFCYYNRCCSEHLGTCLLVHMCTSFRRVDAQEWNCTSSIFLFKILSEVVVPIYPHQPYTRVSIFPYPQQHVALSSGYHGTSSSLRIIA